jgi:hypothetical protein
MDYASPVLHYQNTYERNLERWQRRAVHFARTVLLPTYSITASYQGALYFILILYTLFRNGKYIAAMSWIAYYTYN